MLFLKDQILKKGANNAPLNLISIASNFLKIKNRKYEVVMSNVTNKRNMG